MAKKGYSMIKEMAWNIFKNTGNIDTFLELVELENVEEEKIKLEENNGNNKNEGNYHFGK